MYTEVAASQALKGILKATENQQYTSGDIRMGLKHLSSSFVGRYNTKIENAMLSL